MLNKVWGWIRHPIASYRLRKCIRLVGSKFQDTINKSKEEFKDVNVTNPYAPGTWDVTYVQNWQTGKTTANFFKLSEEEQLKNSEKSINVPNIHDETVEEALEKISQKK